MIICLIFVFTLFVAGLRYRKVVTVDYLTQDQTRVVNGMFVMFVFMSHFSDLLPKDSSFLLFYAPFRGFMRQLIVSTFLFFSGFGLFQSLKVKGKVYIKNFPQKRIFPFIFNAWVAISLFLAYQIFVNGNVPHLQRVLLSFCFLKGFGNSYWYIFAILYVYIAFYLAAYFCYNKKLLLIISFSFLLLVYILLVNTALKAMTIPCWYNTILAIWAGGIFGACKEYFDKFLFSNYTFSLGRYLWLCIITILVFILAHRNWGNEGYRILNYEIAAATLPFLFVLLNIKFRFVSPILDYFGQHVFSIYILQRLSYMTFERLGYGGNPGLYFCLSLFTTLVMSYIFDKFTNKNIFIRAKGRDRQLQDKKV